MHTLKAAADAAEWGVALSTTGHKWALVYIELFIDIYAINDIA